MGLASPGLWLRRACLAVVAAMIGSGGLLALGGIDVLERLPEFTLCLAHNVSGFACPGCGMLRALLRLGQLNLAEANGLHPLSLPFAFWISWVAVGSPGRLRLRALPGVSLGAPAALAIVAVLGVWALRIATGSGV